MINDNKLVFPLILPSHQIASMRISMYKPFFMYHFDDHVREESADATCVDAV